jgi:hypothetical protein
MPLDPRSRERLEALGRTLPQPLPAPEPVRPSRGDATAPRHAVETEDNPEQLFRELMAASADGSVPPHLLDRLRQLEKERLRTRPAASRPVAGTAQVPAAGAAAPSAAAQPRQPSARGRRGAGRSGRAVAAGSEEAELYTAFAQLLLEDEELD